MRYSKFPLNTLVYKIMSAYVQGYKDCRDCTGQSNPPSKNDQDKGGDECIHQTVVTGAVDAVCWHYRSHYLRLLLLDHHHVS